MSGQWEVVGKTKKDKLTGKAKKLTKNEKKNFVDNAPKIEDLLPLAQVKTLYDALDTNKAKPKPIEKAAKTKENEAKKAQKKPKEKKEPAVKDNKPPKTIEAAVSLITASDVQNVLEVGQTQFAEAPLVWLKGLASWLNTKLPVDHMVNTFTAKSWEYPLCLLSNDTRAVLKKALKDVPDSAIQMFYDYCLTSMANDMTKGSPVSGYKMLLQLVATQSPSVAVKDLAKSASLRHSYQNRPSIGCSVMWALGLAGFKDLSTGLRVWQSVMFPVYSLRNYSHFVTDYLKQLLARHSTSKTVSAQQYFEILDLVYSQPNITVNTEFKAHLRTLQSIVCNIYKDGRLHTVFEPVLSRLSLHNPPALKDELLKLLTECLAVDPQSYIVWRQQYTHYLPHSAVLLRHLNSDYSSLPMKQFKDTLRTFKVTNDDMIKHKKKAEGLQECTRLCDSILNKMDKGASFPWKRLIFMFLLIIGGVVSFDITTHGDFQVSKTGVFLRDIGALKYGEQAWLRIQETTKVSYRWAEQYVPTYTAKVKEVLGPYFAVVADVVTALGLQVVAGVKLIMQYCVDKKPIVEQLVNQYAPGLTESLSTWATQAWSLTTHYCLTFSSLFLKYLSVTVQWLRDNVFVGTLSPENLQRVTLEALNSTQIFAAQTFSWLNSKVITESSKSV